MSVSSAISSDKKDNDQNYLTLSIGSPSCDFLYSVLIKREKLCSLIPHSGDMCLLDGVVSWDNEHIICQSDTHIAMNNPLRSHGQLSIVHGIEYGAQAMAVHGGLLARQQGQKTLPGYLVVVRNVDFNAQRLDTIETTLNIRAECLMEINGNLLYDFSVHTKDRILVSGRATIASTQVIL